MSSVNKIIIIGHLGADPEIRYTQGGQAVCNMRVATSESWNDKEGQKQERTEWHQITVWGKSAEHCAQYLTKGRQVYVEGRLQSREYDDKEGVKRKVWEIQADRVNFLGGGEGGGRGEGGGGSSGRDPDGERRGGGQQPGGQRGGSGGRQSGGQRGGNDRGGWGGGGGGRGDDEDYPIPF